MNNKNNRRIFFFTGLGADERAFAYLKITPPFPKVYVSWLTPEENESMAGYCLRLAKHYHIKNGDVLIGLSFGGMVATEINRHIEPALTILISSAATRQELPLPYRMAGKTGIYRLIPEKTLHKPGKLKYFLFGLQKPQQRRLFDEIVMQSDVTFVRWAIRQVVTWNNTERPQRLVKIHGTSDRILPLHKPSTDFIILGGSHFLTWEKADEVSDILNSLLEKSPGQLLQ